MQTAADCKTAQDVLAGYKQLVVDRVREGWHPYLATLMYAPLRGKPQAVIAQMHDEAERVYRIFLPRVVRKPLSSNALGRLPILIAGPDGPVGKSDKPLTTVAVNQGIHIHGVLLVPPVSRLPLPADEHFRRQQALYVRDQSRLRRVDVRRVDDDVGRVVDYALKGVKRGRFQVDDILVLPRATAELRQEGPRLRLLKGRRDD